jgi:hypothetical protein
MAYIGHIIGIRITGINHIPTWTRRFLVLPLPFLFMRNITSGIMVKTGAYVKIANPRKIPEKTNKTLFL